MSLLPDQTVTFLPSVKTLVEHVDRDPELQQQLIAWAEAGPTRGLKLPHRRTWFSAEGHEEKATFNVFIPQGHTDDDKSADPERGTA